jgi:peroxin-1
VSAARNLSEESSSPLNYTALATQTEGYSAIDLQDLVARAVHQASIRSLRNNSPESTSTVLTMEDFSSAQVDFVPLSLRDIKLHKSEVAWSDIGGKPKHYIYGWFTERPLGLHELKRILRETLEWPTKYGPIFAQSPLRLRSGSVGPDNRTVSSFANSVLIKATPLRLSRMR